ncbi:hypothetical protein H5410_036958 [Solanum commersonii]|uniref:Uncharacterized protein n=1 Tax=Solanum commersonii TaxID=4109 RepID=A0A9J5Y9S0_SOLCO|nr:hypothetical protein H5410_036958 [Solanum commersonii]
MEENRDNVPTQQTTSDRNLRRRTRYAQIEKRAESKRQKTLHQSNTTAALTITTSSLSTQQVAASKPTNVPSTSTRREHIVTCLSTFKLDMHKCHGEKRITSIRLREKGLNQKTKILHQSSSMLALYNYHFFVISSTMLAKHILIFYVKSLLININCMSCCKQITFTHTTNKGRNKLEVNLLNDNLVAKDYFLLKKVPNCKFCLAKRFQYESRGFCCNNGSIRLTSHKMPLELQNLFLGDSKNVNILALTVEPTIICLPSLHLGQMYHFIDDLIPSAGKAKIYNYISMIMKMS